MDLPPPTSPPFPTRRSSDLMKGKWVIAAAAALSLALLTLPMLRGGGGEHLNAGTPVSNAKGGACDASGKATFDFTLDRKSTRLNSSHLGISYAVFCLKKKKS